MSVAHPRGGVGAPVAALDGEALAAKRVEDQLGDTIRHLLDAEASVAALTKPRGPHQVAPSLDDDRNRLAAPRRLDHAHRHRLTFGQAANAGGAESRAVDEHVLAEIVAGDESEAPGVVEPLDPAGQIESGRRVMSSDGATAVRWRSSRRPQ